LLLGRRPQFIVGAAKHARAGVVAARTRHPRITEVAILREGMNLGAAECHLDAGFQFFALP
jgi:hypothetical protein